MTQRKQNDKSLNWIVELSAISSAAPARLEKGIRKSQYEHAVCSANAIKSRCSSKNHFESI